MTANFAGSPDYRLVWPHAVLRAELRWLITQPTLDVEAVKRVLPEAFQGDEPRAVLVERSSGGDSSTSSGSRAGVHRAMIPPKYGQHALGAGAEPISVVFAHRLARL